MSTRATYQFVGREHARPVLTLYVHSDGYPSGAAHYFAQMVLHPNQRGETGAETFLRANDGAEWTAGHEAHGDTEYRYTLRGATLQMDTRTASGTWRRTFTGDLADFLNEQAPFCKWSDVLKAGHQFVTHANRTTTRAKLTEQARERLAYAWLALGKGWTGNASGAAGEAVRLMRAGADITEAEVRACLTACCATFPHMVAYYLGE